MFATVIGHNSALRKAVEQARRLSACETPVLICGETGAGKELLARAIHHHSSRRELPFLVIQGTTVWQIPHVHRSSGQTRDAIPLTCTTLSEIIQMAQGGTLYCKNVDALDCNLQEAMLSLLADDRRSDRTGMHAGPAAPRILAATALHLDCLKQNKVFPDAFYEWIAQCTITIPPLRERGNDLLLLARHFAQIHGRPSRHGRFELSDASLGRLLAYDWPGNVQELEETILRTCALSDLDSISPESSSPDEHKRAPVAQKQTPPVLRSGLSLRQAKARAIQQFEREYLARLLSIHRGNVSGAARSAGTERRTFQRLLRKYGLERSDFLESA